MDLKWICLCLEVYTSEVNVLNMDRRDTVWSIYPIIEELLEQLLGSLFGLNKDQRGRGEPALKLIG